MAEYKKAFVAGLTFLVNLITVLLTVGDILPEQYLPYISALLLLAGTYGVYAARNVRRPDERLDVR